MDTLHAKVAKDALAEFIATNTEKTAGDAEAELARIFVLAAVERRKGYASTLQFLLDKGLSQEVAEDIIASGLLDPPLAASAA